MLNKLKVKKVSVKKTTKSKSEIRCPMQKLLNLLNGPWTTYILWLLRLQGPQRFGEFKKQIPSISSKVLTERLRLLEKEKIISRLQEETIPPKVTYSLTKQGKQLDKILDDLNKLAKKWYSKRSL
jgi:DNA-binding HxlR family transcriptional regulator